MKTSLRFWFGWLLGLGLLAGSIVAAETSPRERLLFDFGWKFHLGDDWGLAVNLAKAGSGYGPTTRSFSDASWRRVDLPHDWAIELPFDPKADTWHGFRAVGPGFPKNNIGWYRRTFALPASDAGRRIWIELDGVYRDARVYVNGWLIGHNESGYHGARYDITDVVECGADNVVAVRVDASQTEGWFYEGAGIYRHVWLVKTGPVAIAPDGVFVHSAFKNNVPAGPAEIHLETTLTSALDAATDATVSWRIIGPDGAEVAKAERAAAVSIAAPTDVKAMAQVAEPELWSPETPRLYRLITTVAQGGKVLDRKETTFGIRTFAFDAEKGFILNGHPYWLKGTCNHQDHAGVGSALPDGVNEFRIRKLKELGANAYRTAHNPPTPELLDACDRLGLLVMDECRLVGSDEQHLRWWKEMILRDRNHASVAIWSLGNEEFSVEATPSGARAAATMQALVQRLDPTRPVTVNDTQGNTFTGFNSVIQVRGWSYRIGVDRMDAYHREHPQQPNVGSEQGSTTGTRGSYLKDPVRGYQTAYDDNYESWSNTAEQWMTFFSTRPWLSGGFVWTGFDYRGEPTPYGWPCINSHFGIYDTCGFPKDNFWYYRAWWVSEPVLHLLPHWNWAGREGQEIDVRALTNCDEVELFLNGRSLGRQTLAPYSTLKWKVPYAPGTLSAQGYKAGQLVAEAKVETTGPATAVKLTPDRATIGANREDVSVVAVSILDAQGRVVPTAGNHVTFTLDGPGRIIGVGNGDPSCHEPDTYVSAPAIREETLGGWRWAQVADATSRDAPEVAATFDDHAWSPVDVTADEGPLANHTHAVYRTTIEATPELLGARGVELWLGKVAGDAKIYLNGDFVGTGSDARAAAVLDIGHRLHAGANSVAVAISAWNDQSGLAKGAKLRVVGDAPAVTWSRSAFNGYAQVIVQAGREAGALRLTAEADGLKPATTTITLEPADLRPAVAEK